MTGRENITRTIEFKNPEYVSVELSYSPKWMMEKDEKKFKKIDELLARLKDDILDIGSTVHAASEIVKKNRKISWKDEWGTGWEDDGHGLKAVYHPLFGGYELLKDYKFPDPKLGPHILRENVLNKDDGTKYRRATVWFTLFHRLWMLRGFENMLMDPYTDTKNFMYLRDKIVEFDLERIEQWLNFEVDGIFFSDDWGTQRGLLMNPDDWRKYYKPAYKKLFRKVRDGGAHVWMHLCGDIRLILPDLIELGLNVLNPVQPQAMDVKELAANFGGKVCFNGGVDVQGTLINGTPEDIRREVFTLVELFGKYNGGYIGCTSHSIMPETPLDNIIALCEAFIEVQGK